MNRSFEEFLIEQDELSLLDRIGRLRFLMKEYGPPKILALSEMATFCFEEARICYLTGAWIACVLVAQAALEDLLRNQFRMAGDDRTADHAKFGELVKKSLSERFIFPEEAECIDRLRKLRNPYVHSRPPTHVDGFARRSQASNFAKDYWDLMREDADIAIRCLFGILSRYPFGFTTERGSES